MVKHQKKQELQQKRLEEASRRNRKERRNAKRQVPKKNKSKKKENLLFFNKKDAPQTVQDSIPYLRLMSDGVCQVTKNYFSKTIEFFDTNYALSFEEDQIATYEAYQSLLNYFDSSVNIQLSFVNYKLSKKELEDRIELPEQEEFKEIRDEYKQMLQNQLSKGNNRLVKAKYITFGIEAQNLERAKIRLQGMEVDILKHFRTLGIRAYVLNGTERLKVMYRQFHPQEKVPLDFEYRMLRETGLQTKDFIAPSSLNFSKMRTFMIEKTIGSVSYFDIIGSKLSDAVLSQLLEKDDTMDVHFHIRPLDQEEALKFVKMKKSDVEKSKIEEQKKAVRGGYDMDILPAEMNNVLEDADIVLNGLNHGNNRYFHTTILIMNTAKSRQRLDNTISSIHSYAQQNNCRLRRLDYQQEIGLMSCLPLANNQIEAKRGLLTRELGIFIPFKTQELFQDGEAFYYGLNAISYNMIMANRKWLKNPNGLILGIPGGGKSFTAKREIINCILMTHDDVIICDPEAEYQPLVELLHGQVIHISSTSKDYINPLDLNLDALEKGEDPITVKFGVIMPFFRLMFGKEERIGLDEKNLIYQCLTVVYQNYLKNPIPENTPILEDMYDWFKKQEGEAARHLVAAMELYVHGAMNLFNHHTNVDINNRIVCFDIKDLNEELKNIGMFIVQETVWNRVSANRATHKSTRYYIDEMHLLLRDNEMAERTVAIWKRFRKWGGIPTGITQNVKDLLESKKVENILENSDFICMLSQASGDRKILQEKLNISRSQLEYVKNVPPGQGLLFFGDIILPFVDKFPTDTMLYQVITTKLEEVE